MGIVTISFVGVCTHFVEDPDAVLHRTVLVNGSGQNVIDGIDIPPHLASMTISPTVDFPENQTLSLMGQNVGVLNGAGRIVYEESYFHTVPGLAAQMAGIEVLSPPISDLSWPVVASVFTTASGTFSACLRDGKAAEVTLVIETTDPTVKVTLSPLPGNPPGALTGDFELVSPASVTIRNSAHMEDMATARAHFLLHYLLAAQFPNAPQIPLSLAGFTCPQYGTDSVGCSDANYP